MRLPRTGARLLTCAAAAATILCAGTAQAQTRTRESVVRAKAVTQDKNFVIELGSLGTGEDGGLAGPGPLLYSNQVETGSRFQPAETTPLPIACVDDIPIPVARLAGQTKVSVRKVTFALRRAGSASSFPTDVRGYYGGVSNTLVPGAMTQLPGVVSLPINGAAGFVTQLVTFGDGVTELFKVDLNMSAVPGSGTFVLGVSASGPNPANAAPNGIRITSGVDPNVTNAFWQYNPNTAVMTGPFIFGGTSPPPSTFYMRVEGVPDDCQAPLAHPWCIADVNNDTQVNVTDLLAVIAGWGQVGPMKPAADVAPGLTGDCAVNVTDLLAVIGGWGACPTDGACCVAGSCVGPVNAATCAGLGGTFTFPTATCAATVCPPPNDLCANATVAVAGANNFTNAGATLTAGTPGGDCIVGGNTNITRDVWFKYTTGAVGGVLDISLCNTTGAVTDTTLGLYLGTCAGLTQIDCNDDNCGTTFLSRIPESAYIPPATTALIRVGSWGTGAANQGNMVMNLVFTPKTDDDCIAATSVAIGGSAVGTLGNATGDIGASCAGVSTGIGRWYKVVGNGNNLKASTCTSVPDVYDGRITVYCGTDCGALVCVGASDTDIGTVQGPACPAFQGEEVTFCSVNNQTYWIYVSAPNIPTGVTGNLTVSVTNLGTSCSATVNCAPNAPPANDTCDTAITALIGNTPFSNNLAQPATATLTLCTQPASKDVWFNWVAPASGATTVTVNAAAPFLDSIVLVYTGTCAAPTQVGCNDDPATCAACHGVVQFTAVAGTTYRIQVASWSTAAGGFGNLVISQP